MLCYPVCFSVCCTIAFAFLYVLLFAFRFHSRRSTSAGMCEKTSLRWLLQHQRWPSSFPCHWFHTSMQADHTFPPPHLPSPTASACLSTMRYLWPLVYVITGFPCLVTQHAWHCTWHTSIVPTLSIPTQPHVCLFVVCPKHACLSELPHGVCLLLDAHQKQL